MPVSGSTVLGSTSGSSGSSSVSRPVFAISARALASSAAGRSLPNARPMALSASSPSKGPCSSSACRHARRQRGSRTRYSIRASTCSA